LTNISIVSLPLSIGANPSLKACCRLKLLLNTRSRVEAEAVVILDMNKPDLFVLITTDAAVFNIFMVMTLVGDSDFHPTHTLHHLSS